MLVDVLARVKESILGIVKIRNILGEAVEGLGINEAAGKGKPGALNRQRRGQSPGRKAQPCIQDSRRSVVVEERIGGGGGNVEAQSVFALCQRMSERDCVMVRVGE